jgi:transposase
VPVRIQQGAGVAEIALRARRDEAGLCKLLTEWRNRSETAWLADAPVHPLQQTLKNLEQAYANFEENADRVGAINVLRRGEALLSREGQDYARLACEVSGAVMPPAAGTHRSDSGAAQCHA